MLRTLLPIAVAVLASCHAHAPTRAESAPIETGASPIGESARPDANANESAIPNESDPTARAPLGYALPWCAVDRKPLPEDLVPVVVDGRTFCTCSPQCAEQLKQDASRIAAEVDRATIELQMLDYPLSTCAVSGQELGPLAESMMMGLVLVRTCSPACGRTLETSREAIAGALRTARVKASQRALEPCCADRECPCCSAK